MAKPKKAWDAQSCNSTEILLNSLTMKKMWGILGVTLLLSQGTAYGSGLTGLWLSKKQDVAVRITSCNHNIDQLCGHIAWVAPDEFARKPNLCGTQVLWGGKLQGDDLAAWEGATLYQADDEKYYNAKLWLEDKDKLSLRGYLGVPMIGKTKILTRIDESHYSTCDQPMSAATAR